MSYVVCDARGVVSDVRYALYVMWCMISTVRRMMCDVWCEVLCILCIQNASCCVLYVMCCVVLCGVPERLVCYLSQQIGHRDVDPAVDTWDGREVQTSKTRNRKVHGGGTHKRELKCRKERKVKESKRIRREWHEMRREG